ncbi:hypothetical protein MF6394_01645 [Pseudomonas sp. MF6394]|nr:hypothetical protein MF6394_01645 [Pseudomonas sp. MF6394]
MGHPTAYKTLSGLLRATERVLRDSHQSIRHTFDGLSRGMWLKNAEYVADTQFGDTSGVAELRRKWSTSRPQDLIGGNALFGMPLPTREYAAGDNIPGCGLVQDVHGEQLKINGQWYHKRCFNSKETA